MTQLTVSIEDASMFDQIRQTISLLRGVTSVTLKRQAKTGMDRAIDDIKSGRVYEASSVEDLIKQCKAWSTASLHWRIQTLTQTMSQTRLRWAVVDRCTQHTCCRRSPAREIPSAHSSRPVWRLLGVSYHPRLAPRMGSERPRTGAIDDQHRYTFRPLWKEQKIII